MRKAERRAIAKAKHEAFMEEQRVSGLQAQSGDRKRRKLKAEAAAREANKAKNAAAAEKIHEASLEELETMLDNNEKEPANG